MKTIRTDTHLLLVDETAEPVNGDYGLNSNPRHLVFKSLRLNGGKGSWKIIAASPKIGDLPELETLTIENVCTGRKITNPDSHYFTAFKNSLIDGTWKVISILPQKLTESVERQVTAYNNTYGKGINPEAVPQMVESLIKATKLLNEFSEILVGEWNDDVIDGESVKDSINIFIEALKKSEL